MFVIITPSCNCSGDASYVNEIIVKSVEELLDEWSITLFTRRHNCESRIEQWARESNQGDVLMLDERFTIVKAASCVTLKL